MQDTQKGSVCSVGEYLFYYMGLKEGKSYMFIYMYTELEQEQYSDLKYICQRLTAGNSQVMKRQAGLCR